MICTLYKINNEVVYYTTKKREQPELFGQILSGQIIAYDLYNQPIDKEKAGLQWDTIITRDTGLTYAEQVLANMKLVPIIIATVRSEMVGYSPAEAVVFLSKLSNVIDCLNLGMFYTASQLVSAITTDVFFTTDRIARYTSMLTSADAIPAT